MQLRDREPAGHARGPGFTLSSEKKKKGRKKGRERGWEGSEGREGKETKR